LIVSQFEEIYKLQREDRRQEESIGILENKAKSAFRMISEIRQNLEGKDRSITSKRH